LPRGTGTADPVTKKASKEIIDSSSVAVGCEAAGTLCATNAEAGSKAALVARTAGTVE
jgi:hypothetical protein